MPGHRATVMAPDAIDEAVREAIARILSSGGIFVYPTESSYALGAAWNAPGALDRIQALKGRPATKAMGLVAADAAAVRAAFEDPPPLLASLAEAFWPGPMTLLLEPRLPFPRALVGEDGTVGVRVPGHTQARAVAACAPSGLLTATSANLGGEPPACSVDELPRAIREGVDLVLDLGPTAGGAPSTLVAQMPDGRVRIVRPGALGWDALSRVVGAERLVGEETVPC